MSDPVPDLRQLLTRVSQGECSIDHALKLVEESRNSQSSTMPLGPDASVQLDVGRAARCGFPEAIYAPGKADADLVAAFRKLSEQGQGCLATRCSEAQAAALLGAFPDAIHHKLARTVRLPVAASGKADTRGRVAVVTAGTSDRPVAEEALETLRWMGVESELILDIGVAGPQRLLQQKHRFEDADAVIVVAGMEGALPSVVAGWVPCPVIAVPTSVGYGASFGGISALLGMLNSCAANVAVVNIDAGFKGAYLAGLIARRLHPAPTEEIHRH